MSEQKSGSPTGTTDASRELAVRLKAKDGAALAELYDRFGKTVYSLALRIVRVPGDAEEVTQEVFLYAWEKADLFDGSRGTLASWLCTLARSRGIDRLRQRQSQVRRKDAVSRDADASLSAVRSPDRDFWSLEVVQMVRSALEQLPVDQRQAIEIAYFEGLSQSEIADRLQTPLGTIKTRIRQGMIRLKSSIGPILHLEPE